MSELGSKNTLILNGNGTEILWARDKLAIDRKLLVLNEVSNIKKFAGCKKVGNG